MITLVFWFLAAGMLAAAVLSGARRVWLLALIAVALCWDNLIIAAGAQIGAGNLLRALSIPRYVAHAVLTPLMMLVAFRVAGLRRRPWLWALTAVLIAGGIYSEILHLRLDPREYLGTLRYANAAAGPPVPAILTVLVLIGVGGVLWRREGWPWLCLGAIAMFVAAGSGVFWLGNAGELALVGAILLTALRRDGGASSPALAAG